MWRFLCTRNGDAVSVRHDLFRDFFFVFAEACKTLTVKDQSAPLCVTANDVGVWQSPLWEWNKREPNNMTFSLCPQWGCRIL